MNPDQMSIFMIHQPVCKKWSLLINAIYKEDKKATCNFEQGTGLELSLSFDMVKVHGGEINIKSKEVGASEFKISLPIK